MAYGPSLTLPFIGDDYVFLDATRHMALSDVGSRANVYFGWWRPWSRELHYWVLYHAFGPREWVFRGVGALLWVGALMQFAWLVRRLGSPRTAVVATLGVAALPLWGTPLLWIAGGQDLWMLNASLATIALHVAGRRMASWVTLAVALLSKETAAVVPVLLVAYDVWLERLSIRAAIRRAAVPLGIGAAWFAVHPTLWHRLFDPAWRDSLETQLRPPMAGIALRAALAAVGLDAWPRPIEVGAVQFLRLALSWVALAGGAWWCLARAGRLPDHDATEPRPRRMIAFAITWALAGTAPLLLPSAGWHAYYGCLGMLGIWFAIGTALAKSRPLSVAMIGLLVGISWANAHTLSWDWGTEWYQRRAGNFLRGLRTELLWMHPQFPPHARLFFGGIPNNVGFITGQSPAVRVWYDDSTLAAGFYSTYTPRPPGGPAGVDYFFVLDSTRGVVEIVPGHPDVAARDAEWERHHEALAMLFVRAGDWPRAGEEFEKLAALPSRPEAIVLAGVCWQQGGAIARANRSFEAAARRYGRPLSEVMVAAEHMRARLPAGAAR